MELRMYGLVNYQLTGIQKGIQFLHGVTEYEQMSRENGVVDLYNKWASSHKTVILLNGGTTNYSEKSPGTMNSHLKSLKDNGVICSYFNEPDLGDQLTAISFIVDERVFNKDKYPDFSPFKGDTSSKRFEFYKENPFNPISPAFFDIKDKSDFQKWQDSVGGPSNVFLREFLKQFRLACG